jgi:uncharacterized membrane protein
MKIWLFLFLLIVSINSVQAQQTINEEQLLLNGYVDTSGKVLMTGYETPESLPYMTFLQGTNYTFDNNTNQLYVVTDKLTSKNADVWSLNFSLDGYYSDYSITFYLPAGSEINRFELQPELNYQFQVKEDSLAVSIQGYNIVAPWIKMEYRLPAEAQAQNQSKGIFDPFFSSLVIILIAGGTFVFYRRRRQIQKDVETTVIEGTQDTLEIPETKSEIEIREIQITGEMQKVIDTLSEKEKAIVSFLIRNGGSATQADIRYETMIPKSSLTGLINALKRKNIIRKHEQGRTNRIEFSEWFLYG